MNSNHVVDPNSIEYYRYNVKFLFQELWQEKDPQWRMNIALQLADATTHLAPMEAEEYQKLQAQTNASEDSKIPTENSSILNPDR
jgi:hypothetical protein